MGVAHTELAGDLDMVEHHRVERVSRRAESSVYRERKRNEDCVALQDGRHDVGHALLLHFGVLEEGFGPGESVFEL